MDNKNNNLIAIRHWKKFTLFVVAFAALFFAVSTLLPLEYRSDASILITQKNAQGLDAYKEVKSAEFTGKIVGQIILSNSFMEGVIARNEIARHYFGLEPNAEKRIKDWRESISVSQTSNTGIINISFYAASKDDSRRMLESVIDLMQTEGPNFHGNSEIGIKVVNSPYVFNSPSSPSLILNTLAGAVTAVVLILIFSQIFGEKFVRIFEARPARHEEKSKIVFFSHSDEKISDHDMRRMNKLFQA